MPSQSLAEFAAPFDRNSLKPLLDAAERDREKFRAMYPMEGLGTLTLEEYAAGGSDDRETLARMLAIGTPALGDVRGAAFNQTRIFRLKGTDLYKSTLENAGEAADDWLRLRAALVKCCELAAAGDWEAIDRVSVSNWIPAIRTKLTHIYFPDEVLPMYVSGELGHFLDALRVGFYPGGGKWAAAPNRRLLLHLRAMPELAGWSPTELVLLLRAWFPKPKDKTEKMTQPEAVLRAMRELRDEDPTADGVVHFKTVKDYVLDSYGMDIAACGTVMADMVAPALSEQNQTSKVPSKYRQLERVNPGSGLYRLLQTGFDLNAHQSSGTPDLSAMPTLNQILYGPPGTGKTYSVIRRAAKIATGRDDLSDAEAKQHYDELFKTGHIRLATFHQSFSYEDFIEGIRPVMEEGGAARFEVRDGVFKEIAMEAMFACLERTAGNAVVGGFESRWHALMDKVEASDDRLTIPGVQPQTTYELSRLKSGNLSVRLQSGTLLHGSRRKLERIYAKCHDKQRINTGDAHRADGVSGHHNANAAIFNYMQTLQPATDVPVQLSSDDQADIVTDFLREGPASGWQLRADRVFPPYVLIIDEINRGNISRIFGELITLIEDDKRHGTDNALTVTLPISRELFTVPPNLFLLGTMNTADKSLALLDVALRRRFEFEELAPDFTCCTGFPPLPAVMDEMNLRLELCKDRDHRIGHAFFMSVTDAASFNQAFRRKVVPLLQEYFFNDIEGARYVLGDSGTGGFLRELRREDKQRHSAWRWFTDVEQGLGADEKLNCWNQLRSNYGLNNA